MSRDTLSMEVIQCLGELLFAATGQLIDSSKSLKISSVIRPVLRRHGISCATELARLLQDSSNGALRSDCLAALVNKETSFYRDRDVFARLLGPVLDELRQQKSDGRCLRIWSAGCSTGQEAYSLAMHFAEQRERWAGWQIEILASDACQSSVDQAQEGRYTQLEIQKGLPVSLMLRYFHQEGKYWIAKPQLRHMVSFYRQNMLHRNADLGPFDLILCRNVLMHLPFENQEKLLANLKAGLNPKGVIMLGAGETMAGKFTGLQSDHRFGIFYHHADPVKEVA